MKPALAVLTLAFASLAALAVPVATADLPAGCTYEGGDTDCVASAGPCAIHTHTYDVEDHPNTYDAGCGCTEAHLGGGPLVEQSCSPAPPAPPATPVRDQCSAGMEQSFCTLTVGPCHETSGSNSAGEVTHTWQSAGCTTPAGACAVTSYDHGVPTVACTNPQGAAANPGPQCQSGIAQDWCTVQAAGCLAKVTTWTAWGDRWASLDCAGCHAEVHTDDPADPQACA